MGESARFFIFHGKDEFTQAETLRKLKSDLGDPAMVDLNTSYFNGATVRLGELIHACSTVPFLAERRLVVVEGLLEQLGGTGREKEREALLDYLPQLPASTRLILLEGHICFIQILQKHAQVLCSVPFIPTIILSWKTVSGGCGTCLWMNPILKCPTGKGDGREFIMSRKLPGPHARHRLQDLSTLTCLNVFSVRSWLHSTGRMFRLRNSEFCRNIFAEEQASPGNGQ